MDMNCDGFSIGGQAGRRAMEEWLNDNDPMEIFKDLGPENTVGDLMSTIVEKGLRAVLGEELWNRTIISFEGKKGEESIDYAINRAIFNDEEMKKLYLLKPNLELV